jgi:hypothetical protein
MEKERKSITLIFHLKSPTQSNNLFTIKLTFEATMEFVKHTQLKTRADWQIWIDSIADLAQSYDVWEYCDPDESTTSPDEESVRLGLRKVNERITSTVQESHRILYAGIRSPRGKIQALSKALQPTTKDQTDEVRDLYEALKKGPKRAGTEQWLNHWVIVTHRAKALRLENLSEQQICEGFIESCSEINTVFYTKMKGRKVDTKDAALGSAVDKIQSSLLLMLETLQPHTPALSTRSTPTGNNQSVNNIRESIEGIKEALPEKDLTILDCIRMFRETATKPTSRRTHAAFGASLGSEQLEPDLPSKESPEKDTTRSMSRYRSSKKEDEYTCACRMRHLYSKCFYLNPAITPKGWKPRDTIQARVVSEVNGNAKLQQAISTVFKKMSINLPEWWPEPKDVNDTNNHAHAIDDTIHAAYGIELSDSREPKTQNLFKLDTAATIHVTGEFDRFTKFEASQHSVKHGDTESTIQGFGNVNIKVETLQGTKCIEISQVAYVPGFYFNIISAGMLQERGLYHQALDGWLVNKEGKRLYKVNKLGRLYTLEKPDEDAVVFASSLPSSK